MSLKCIAMILSELGNAICSYLTAHPSSSSKEIFEGIKAKGSYATVKRELTKLLDAGWLTIAGKGKSTKYSLKAGFSILIPIDPKTYFKEDIDQRRVKLSFDFVLMETLSRLDSLFTDQELEALHKNQSLFESHIRTISPELYRKEFERLAIDLSWKSSQIEGNTYSLLETERLLKEKITANGKTKDEAIMLLNHKAAIDYVVDNPGDYESLSVRTIEDLHSILTKELDVQRNIRHSRVGITGTNYRPLDNEYQIREALESMCSLIQTRKTVFEKALLALVLVSYIQPFEDGNKRTARILCNAILIHHQYCPISFRSVDPIDFKEAMLIFYEQNNLSVIRRIFMEQFEFAVKTYF